MICLPRLRKISVMDHGVIPYLVLPALSEVEIYPSDDFVKGLTRCIERSSCSVIDLKVDFDEEDPLQCILSYLPSLSTLTSLSLDEARGDGSSRLHFFTELLTLEPRKTTAVLPSLQTLKVSTYAQAYMEFDHKPLADMVRSRWYAGDRIQRLQCFYLTVRGVQRYGSERRYPGAMKTLHDEGMDIWMVLRP